MAKKNNPKAAAAAPKGKRVPKEFRLKLNEAQIKERGKQAAKIGMELKALEEQFKAEEDAWKARKAAHKSQVKNLNESRKKLDEEITTGSAMVTEDVILVLNHDANQAEYHYQVQGEGWQIVDTRPLEDNERQLHLVEDQVAQMPEEGQDVAE